MLKKWTEALSLCNTLHGLYCCPPVLSTLSQQRRQTLVRRKPRRSSQQPQCRHYAVVAGGYSTNKHEHLPWPEVALVNAIPTPYQIFNQKKGSPYSKGRFYELVKLYHPDRRSYDDATDKLPLNIKLERYRLVIAANDILSDPVKRLAYDCYGAGWNEQPEVRGAQYGSNTANGWARDPEGDWDGRGSPFQNATWEDWEKWHHRTEKNDQRPTYFSNGTFVGLIVVCAALGGIGQATRAGNYSMTFIEQRDALHNEMSRDLMRRRKESNEHGNRNERVHSFLRQRDSLGYGLINTEEKAFRKLLLTPEVCSSGDIEGQSTKICDVKKHSEDSRNCEQHD